ncbi:uncharacterized protein F5891DRAFT_1187440 [Suillus fuscotomentosus]|uniref:DUF6570 domain-containing protein n=1 Tax=Suillus fuscotomentosus TaxID=1912939 RepID=A0AAD4E8F0_9AGAM|nr:uncharacterized protein F5891DRAFT_1187440 [Suillus fuscotomentosus]KAG1901584.1 hypothetical protein F5891DRAFT_1187440 [Suillus fuscotomentosus]
MDDGLLSAWLSDTALPVGCVPSHAALIVSHLCDVYGDVVAAALRRPAPLPAFNDLEDMVSEASASLSMLWLNVPMDDLSCALCTMKLLRVTDPFIVQACVVQSLSVIFTFGHNAIDGIMLDKAGVKFDVDSGCAVEFNVCIDCWSSLGKSRVPQLALTNDLYQGSLLDQFANLTWVEEKPRVSHGNTCAHEMNTVSTTNVLPHTHADVNGFLSVVFIGPEKFDPKQFGSLFCVWKQKIWDFLDGPIPGLDAHVVEDHELNVDSVFNLKTAGFSEHPTTLFTQSPADDSVMQPCMVEKTGVSDPESVQLPGRSFVASAIRNLLPREGAESRPAAPSSASSHLFMVGKSNLDTVACKLTSVTPGLLECLAVKLECEHKLVNPSIEECNALQLLQQVNTLSARIPGSQALKIFV